MTGIANSGFGVITGGVNVVIQFFKNLGLTVANIALGIGNAIAALASNMMTAFHNAICNVQSWFYNLLSTALSVIEGICAALNKLPFGGTVHVVITDSDDYGEASSTLVQYVQQTLDPEETAGEGYGLAPIGHVVSVASASPVSIEVKTTVTFEEGHNWSNTKAAIAEAVDAYFLELRKNWSETSQTIVRVSQIENRILGVDGVVDVTGTKLNGTASNMTLTEFCIPKLGGVSA